MEQFNKHLLKAYDVLGTVVNTIGKTSDLMEHVF